MLRIAVLGAVEVTRDGRRLPVPGGKVAEVLVRLALDAGEPVRADRIIEDLWAGTAAGTARNTLQSKVSQLRHALGEPNAVVGAHGGYTLMVTTGQVDALRVHAVAAAARASLRSGNPRVALNQATEALASYSGDILADAGEGPWLAPHRARLEELRLGLLEDQCTARVQLGADGGVIGDLETLVALHPLRESFWSSLITALYRSDRQADALAAYARVRSLLKDELGLDPGPQLQALESDVLSHRLYSVQDVDRQPAVLVSGNLPRRSTPLVGRDADLAGLLDRMGRHRLVTVVGTAGVGKTRLAVEAARGSVPPGGVWLVRLDEFDPAATTSIVQMVAETMYLASGSVLEQRLSDVDTVVIFDNCEHVVAEVALLINALLDAAPTLRVLATSQVPLGVDDEDVYPLDPLSPADSVQLFTARAVLVAPALALDIETRAAIEDVCRSLDGLPLAIELAAARAKALSVQEIGRRLPDRFALLSDPTSRQPSRRRALIAAISWSYDLLFPDDQRGLWALSCFAGSAPLAGAEHVLQQLGVPASAAVDVLARLVDRSLVSVIVQSGGGVRYRLLDSIRAYAALRLRETGSADAVLAAHAQWFAERADWCAETVRGPGQFACVSFVHDERANIDAALAWSAEHSPRMGLRIVNGVGWTWVVVGDGVAGAARIRAALAAVAGAAPAADRITAHLTTSWLEASAGNLQQAQRDLDEATAATAQVSQGIWLAEARRTETFLRLQQGRPEEARDSAEQAAELYRQYQSPWGRGGTLLLGGYAAMMTGATAQASEHAHTAVTLLRPLGDPWTLAHAEALLGAIAGSAHRLDEAAEHLGRAVQISHRLGFAGQEAFHLTTLGRTQQRSGELRAAVATLWEAIAVAGRSGDARMAATARLHLARVHRATGHPAAAAELLEVNLAWYRNSGGGDGELLTRCLVAIGPPPRTQDLLALLSEAERTHHTQVQVLALDALARTAAEAGDTRAARTLMEQADALAASIPHLIGDDDRVDAIPTRNVLTTSGTLG